MIYHSVEVYKAKWAGYISAKNKNVEYWHTENKESRFLDQACITTNEKEIALITKEFFTRHRTFNLPKSIRNASKQSEKKPSVFMVKQIEVNAFDNEVALRVMSDKNTFLIFNSFSPQSCKLTKQQVVNFENLLMDITNRRAFMFIMCFWKYDKDIHLDCADTCTKLSNGEFVNGVNELDIDEIMEFLWTRIRWNKSNG
jgi:hypothetical protein